MFTDDIVEDARTARLVIMASELLWNVNFCHIYKLVA